MPKATPKKRLTREQIIETAIAVADQQGLEDLSMRSLARELGFGVMSLYNHVKDKEDLLQAMADAAASEIKLPRARTTWQKELRACAISAYRIMLKHPWLPGLWGSYLGVAKNRYHNAILRSMREADLSMELSCRGFHAITMHVVGFALQALEMPFTTKKEFVAFGQAHLQDLTEQDLPYLSEHVHYHLAGKDTRSDFKYMLDLILDGIDRDAVAARK